MESRAAEEVVVQIKLQKTSGPDLGFKELMERIVTAAPDVPWEISDTKFSIVAVDFISTNVPEDGT